MLAFLQGADLWIVLGIVVLLVGGAQIPKLARSLGTASHEFKKGIEEGAKAASESESSKDGDKGAGSDTKATTTEESTS